MLYFAIYWLFSALIFLNSQRVDDQVQLIIFKSIAHHINEGKLKGASLQDIKRISNQLSLMFTIIIVVMAPFFLAFNLFLLTLKLLKGFLSGLFKKGKSE